MLPMRNFPFQWQYVSKQNVKDLNNLQPDLASDFSAYVPVLIGQFKI